MTFLKEDLNQRKHIRKMNKEIYLKEIMPQIPRILGQLNRNPSSSTYGSFDREFWHYKTADFSCARKQEATLTLALLWKLKDKKNPYCQNNSLLAWINAAMQFWMRIQNKNSSFSEWYPNEGSFAATAFTLYAATETLLEMGECIKDRQNIITCLKRAGDWLVNRKEVRAENQECGAVAGLFNLYLLTKEDKFKIATEDKIRQLQKRQNKEGWFNEYGGADIGYLSLAIDYLAKYYTKSKDETALRILEKCLDFIQYFLHPNYTSGGEYGSRNTEYLIPHGFELIDHPKAEMIALFIRTALENKTTVGIQSLDDRYLLYNSYTYLQAYQNAKKIEKTEFPFQTEFEKHFRNAGLFIKSAKKYYAVINYFKNSFRIISKTNKEHVLYDSGIELNNGNERLQPLTQKKELNQDGDYIWVQGNFCKIPEINPTPTKTILIRAFKTLTGNWDKIDLFLKERLRNLLITDAKAKKGYSYRRGFAFDADKIRIVDEVDGQFKELFINTKSSYNYIPSSRYFTTSELNNEIKHINGNFKKVLIEREFDEEKTTLKWPEHEF